MALGTPIVAGTAYSAVAGTTVSPAYPAGVLATDVVVLFVGQKPVSSGAGSITTPTGWTLRDQLDNAGGYSGGAGIDTGVTSLRVYTWDNPVAGQTGTRSVTLGGNDVTWAFMVRIPSGGETHSFGSADGQRTTAPTAGTPFTVALTNGASATNFEAGDIALWAMCIPTDVTTPNQFSAQSVTATGATFATAVELNEPDSSVSNDIGGYSAYATVTAGSSTTAPSVTVTAAGTVTNVRGPVVMLRIRDLSQALTQTSRYNNTNTFYSPTVTQTTAAQNLAPARYNNTNTFYPLDIEEGPYDLHQTARFNNTNAYYSATVTQSSGAQNILPNRYTNVSTFYSATVSQTAPDQTLAPSLYTNGNAFYTPTISVEAANLKPDTLVNANAFYTAVLDQGPVTISPARLDNQNTFYMASASRGLRPALFTNANTFYSHSALARYAILPTRYDSQNAFFAATASIEQFLIPPLVGNQNAFFAAHLAIDQFITAPLVTSTNTVYAVNAQSNYTLTPISIASTNAFYTPTIAVGPAFILPILFSNQNRFYKQSVLWWDNQPAVPETWDGIADTPAAWDSLPITVETWTELSVTETSWDRV